MTKTLKRVIALLSVSMFMALFSLSCFAQENSSAKKIYTEDLHPIGRILSFPNNICRVLRGERQRLQ